MTNYYDVDILQHHGILGQKWGKRNGPPYPLDYQDHSPLQKRLNSKAAIDGKPGGSSERSKLREMYKAEKAERKEMVKSYSSTKSDSPKLSKEEQAKRLEGLRRVDPSLAKNSKTRKVAEDYNNLSDQEFLNKYYVKKDVYAKRYVKSDGDTYGMGVKRVRKLENAEKAIKTSLMIGAAVTTAGLAAYGGVRFVQNNPEKVQEFAQKIKNKRAFVDVDSDMLKVSVLPPKGSKFDISDPIETYEIISDAKGAMKAVLEGGSVSSAVENLGDMPIKDASALFEESIDAANKVGVSADEILKNLDDIDRYFMN